MNSAAQVVAIQGYQNSYHDILRQTVWPGSQMLGFGDFHTTVKAVQNGEADFGIIAVFNSIYGGTPATIEIRNNFSNLVVIGEQYLDISHRLLGAQGAEINEIRSHPVALGQCRETIHKLYPGVRLVESDDTAGAAYEVAELIQGGVTNVAAVASKAAGESRPELYELHASFQDAQPNRTRFLLFRYIAADKKATDYIPDNSHKSSTVLTIPNKQSSLVHVLQVFSDQGIDFTYVDASSDRIDSMGDSIVVPFDFAASWIDPATQAALKVLAPLGVHVRLVGSYPAGDVLAV